MKRITHLFGLAIGAAIGCALLKVWSVDPWAAVQIALGLGLVAGVFDAVTS